MRDDLILFDSDGVVVAQKPSGIPVHHSREHRDADHALLQLVRDRIGARVYTVHRLDRATSGAVLFGRTPEVASALRVSLASPTTQKLYLALVKGRLQYPVSSLRPLTKRETGTVQEARTTFWPIQTADIPDSGLQCSLIHAQIFTGRRHQIRRHLNHLRHQILGDTTYGKGKVNRHVRGLWGLPRLALHAARLVIPWGDGVLDIQAPLPEDLKCVLEQAGLKNQPLKSPEYGR